MKRLLKISSMTGSTAVPTAAGQHHVVARRYLRPPAGLDDGGAGRLHDDRRPVDQVARRQVAAVVERRLQPGVGAEHPHRGLGLERSRAAGRGEDPVLRRLGLAHGLHGQGLDDERLAFDDEAVALPVRRLEARGDRGDRVGAVGVVDHQGRVGALVAQVRLAQDGHAGVGDVLAAHLLASVRGELPQDPFELRHDRVQ
jgi:hypothetical protein